MYQYYRLTDEEYIKMWKEQEGKCKICGNIVEVVHAAKGELVCCGQPMEKQTAGTTDGATEKHVPVIEKTQNGYKIKVGSVAHPMLEAQKGLDQAPCIQYFRHLLHSH